MRPERLGGETDQFLGLPAKITIIVFWGMVVLGVAGGYFILDSVEKQVRSQYKYEAQYLAGQLDTVLDDNATFTEGYIPASLADRLSAAVRETETVRGVRLSLPHLNLDLGAPRGSASLTQTLNVYTHGLGRHVNINVSVYQNDVSDILAKRRKDVLVAIGLSLLCFGALLQLLLRALLSRPFEEMTTVVRAYQAGDESSRFDASRRDEFGYVAKFFNAALDSVAERRKREMQRALSRADASETALRIERELASITLDAIGDAVLRVDQRGRITYANPAAESLMALSGERLIGVPLAECLHLYDERDATPLPDPIGRCLQGEVVHGEDHVVLRRDAENAVDVSLLASPIKGDNGDILGAVLVMHDTGHVRRLTRELSHQANHDALTGLHNRRGFERVARRLLGGDIREGNPHMLCLIDMDQFKLINDICGHSAGDKLLCEMAGILRDSVRQGDVVARLGGDEFALLLTHCDESQALQIAETILARTRHHGFECGGHHFNMGASIGIAATGTRVEDISETMRAADIACYIAKENGRGLAHVYNECDEATRQHQSNMHWVVRINRALAEDNFRLYAQPVVPVSQKPGVIGYHEVLIRLADHDGELTMPNAFLPAAERYGLMPAIDRWVVEKTLGTMRYMSDRGGRLAINLSGLSLREEDFLPFLLRQIDASGVDPRRLMFEITETAAVPHIGRTRVLIEKLTARGCAFALDDFGSGVSSFAYLRELGVSHLKIDGHFVSHMLSNPVDYNIVGAACAVAGSLNLYTVAEWVENQEILESLRILSVDFAQGAGVGLPMPLETLFA